jgi:ferredoxin, 2Fe-2S
MNMALRTYTIEFTGLYEGQEYRLESYENEYRNLMALLKDKISPDDFGQCGGMGRCGTCLVTISGMKDGSCSWYKNEQNTLSKMAVTDPAARLSCQIEINRDLTNAIIQLFDNI